MAFSERDAVVITRVILGGAGGVTASHVGKVTERKTERPVGKPMSSRAGI